MAARGSTPKSRETKGALLDAARQVFATQGIEAASLRAIQRLAGLSTGTAQYHFASKEDMLAALLAREREGINKEIARLSTQLIGQKKTPDAASIVEALALPHIEFIKNNPISGPKFLSIIAQLSGRSSADIAPLVSETRVVMPDLLLRAYPNSTMNKVEAALLLIGRALLFLLASYAIDEAERGPGPHSPPDILLQFIAGGLDSILRKENKKKITRRTNELRLNKT